MRFSLLPTSYRTDKPGWVGKLNFCQTVSSITCCKHDLELYDRLMAVMRIMEMLNVKTAAGCNPKHESATPTLRPGITETLNFLSSESELTYKDISDIVVLLLADAHVMKFAGSDHLLYLMRFLVSYSLATAVLRSGFQRDAPLHHAREMLRLMPESNIHFLTGFSIICARHSQ